MSYDIDVVVGSILCGSAPVIGVVLYLVIYCLCCGSRNTNLQTRNQCRQTPNQVVVDLSVPKPKTPIVC